jgi:hypothetical protein
MNRVFQMTPTDLRDTGLRAVPHDQTGNARYGLRRDRPATRYRLGYIPGPEEIAGMLLYPA